MLPTLEIAKLAAILASGNGVHGITARAYADQAIDLWIKSGEERAKRINLLAIKARTFDLRTAKSKLPKPKSFPTTLDDFLRCMMPNKRTEHRERFHREYARQMIRDHIPTEVEVDECIAREKKEQISSYVYEVRADDFRRWMKEFEASNRKRRAQAGARAKSKKNQNGAA